MKAIIQYYTPEEIERIARGEQTIKVRKTAPKEVPFKVYIYQTKHRGGNFIVNEVLNAVYGGKVIGEFICNQIEKFTVGSLRSDDIEELACLSYTELINYFYKPCELDGKTAKQGYAWHISDLKIYDKPKELSEFKTIKCTNKRGSCSDCKIKPDCIKQITRPPQSWQYVEPLDK